MEKENNEQANNPLHGVKLAEVLDYLVDTLGWEELGARVNIRCFNSNPSINSSLKFLRKTPWARDKVEYLYLQLIGQSKPKRKNAKSDKVVSQQTPLKDRIRSGKDLGKS